MLRPARENRLILGLSGGMDSMCLLHVLMKLNESGIFAVSLTAVHVNHCLRGADADADEAFVREYCENAGVSVKTFRVNVREIARRDKLSLEEAGRAQRARVFREVMAETGADALALAHHADDSAETVLMRIGRGSGPSGLAGISPKGGGIIRPLIEVSREEIAHYAAENSIPFRHDKSNDSAEYTRNRVRHVLLPEFSRVFGHDVRENIARLSDIAREENEWVDGVVARVYEGCVTEIRREGNAEAASREMDIPYLAGQHPALIKRLIRMVLRGMKGGGKDVSLPHMNEIYHLFSAQTGKTVFLPGNISARRSYDRLIFSYIENTEKNKPAPQALLMDGAVFEPESGLWFTMSSDKKESWQNFINVCTKKFICGTIPGNVEIRTRRPGDRIRLKNAGTQKLSDYFINNKVPRGQRDRVLLAAAGGDILWIMDERNAVSADFFAEGSDAENAKKLNGDAVYIQSWAENPALPADCPLGDKK